MYAYKGMISVHNTCTVAACGEPWADLTKDNVVLLGVMQSL